jgi:hypothetical protein
MLARAVFARAGVTQRLPRDVYSLGILSPPHGSFDFPATLPAMAFRYPGVSTDIVMRS